MAKNALFERNLLALGTVDKLLSSRCAYSDPMKEFSLLESRTGVKVPCIEKDGRINPLHSRFDPVKEGNRFPELYRNRGFLLFFGFGGAYHITPFLQDSSVEKILVVERSLPFFISVLCELDLMHLLLDRRITYLIGEEPETVGNTLLTQYLPILTGDIQSIVLRPAVQLDTDYFNEVTDRIHEVLEQVGDDFTVQTRFGKKWFRNTVSNLRNAEVAAFKIGSARKVLITAAGPSLDENVEKIEEMRNRVFLIATDTSLPALLHRNIRPDIVISIDCQDISYNHFMQGYPEDVPLLLDLASPVRLTRFSGNQLFFSSGHPFSIYVNRNFRKFPQIDTSGGNVTYAALSLAVSLGAREVFVIGADFSYPRGKCYAKETYLYPWFRNLESRYSSLESAFFAFMMHNNTMIRDDSDGFIRYISKPMIGYRKLFESAANNINVKVTPIVGSGCPLNIIDSEMPSFPSIRPVFSAGTATMSTKEFLISYRNKLMNLPEPAGPLWKYVGKLDDEQLKLIMTLLPAAAEIRQKVDNRESALLEALRWTVGVLEREIDQLP